MTNVGGWHVWVDHNGEVRMFTVAHPDIKRAEAMVLDRIKGATALGCAEASVIVIEALGMEPNQIGEWGTLRTVGK